ncbi:MAG: FecR family protein [Petrimonas sp.]|nr:FecR family protein [Petrimonas sp.]MEA4979261.1 FecR family protein [Petrimonas sp.]
MEEQLQHIKLLAFRYFEGKISPEDAEVLFSFLKEGDFNPSLFRKWEDEWLSSLEFQPELNERWEKIKLANRNTEFIKKSIPVVKSYRNYVYAAVSIALLIIGSIVAFISIQDHQPEQYFTLETPLGQKSKITMPDGTLVWLNSGSSLIYSNKYGKGNREVKLSGEAYFEVKKGPKRFIVQINGYSVTVKGTKFNVSAYSDDQLLTTTLLEGRVEFNYMQGSLEMAPGETMEMNLKTNSIMRKKTGQSVNSWTRNRLDYGNIELEELLKKLSREYARTILLDSDSLKKQSFSISIDTNKDLADVLNAIAEIIPIKIINQNDTIKLKPI